MIIIKGPWAAAVASSNDPEKAEYTIVRSGCASYQEAEAFLRRHYKVAMKEGRAFPYDVRRLLESKEKIKVDSLASVVSGNNTKQ